MADHRYITFSAINLHHVTIGHNLPCPLFPLSSLIGLPVAMHVTPWSRTEPKREPETSISFPTCIGELPLSWYYHRSWKSGIGGFCRFWYSFRSAVVVVILAAESSWLALQARHLPKENFRVSNFVSSRFACLEMWIVDQKVLWCHWENMLIQDLAKNSLYTLHPFLPTSSVMRLKLHSCFKSAFLEIFNPRS